MPVTSIEAIGAGGGSIVTIDGGCCVSARAVPGPILVLPASAEAARNRR